MRFSNNTQVNESHEIDNDAGTIREDNAHISPRRPQKGLRKTQRAPLEIIGHLERVISHPPARFSFTEFGDFIALPYLWAIFLWSVFARRHCQIKDSLANSFKLRLWHDLVVSFSTNARVTLFPNPQERVRSRKWLPSRYCRARNKQYKYALCCPTAPLEGGFIVFLFFLQRHGGHRLRRPKASVVECLAFQRDSILSENRMASCYWTLLVCSQLANSELYSFKCVTHN